MSTTNVKSQLPKLDGVGALADAVTLATGIVSLANNALGVIDIKMSDIISYSKDVYTAGTINQNTIDLTGASLISNNSYSLSVKLPNLVSFFGGGLHANSDATESDAAYTVRTYKVYTDATATATELADLFALRMQGDLSAGFTATAAAGVITIVACDATAGSFIVDVSNITGAVVTDSVPNVLPVGEPKEVQKYMNAELVVAATYDRYVIKFRKYIHHQAVKGLEVIKEEKLILFSDTADTLPTTLDPILDGSYVTVADYLGAPSV